MIFNYKSHPLWAKSNDDGAGNKLDPLYEEQQRYIRIRNQLYKIVNYDQLQKALAEKDSHLTTKLVQPVEPKISNRKPKDRNPKGGEILSLAEIELKNKIAEKRQRANRDTELHEKRKREDSPPLDNLDVVETGDAFDYPEAVEITDFKRKRSESPVSNINSDEDSDQGINNLAGDEGSVENNEARDTLRRLSQLKISDPSKSGQKQAKSYPFQIRMAGVPGASEAVSTEVPKDTRRKPTPPLKKKFRMMTNDPATPPGNFNDSGFETPSAEHVSRSDPSPETHSNKNKERGSFLATSTAYSSESEDSYTDNLQEEDPNSPTTDESPEEKKTPVQTPTNQETSALFSPNSGPTKATAKRITTPANVVVDKVTPHEVSFKLSIERPPTESRSRKNYDHITAFTTFVELIYASCIGQGIDGLTNTLEGIIDGVFHSDISEELLENLKSNLNEHATKGVSRENRKMLTAVIRNLSEVSSKMKEGGASEENKVFNQVELLAKRQAEVDLSSQLTNSIKLADNTSAGFILAEISSKMIRLLNGAEAMCFRNSNADATDGKKNTDSQHANEVKQALYNLRLMNLLEKASQLERDKKTEELAYCLDFLDEELSVSFSPLKRGLKGLIIADMNRTQPNVTTVTDNASVARNVSSGMKLRPKTVSVTNKKRFNMSSPEVGEKALYLIEKPEKLRVFFENKKSDQVVAELIGKSVGDLFDYSYKSGDRDDPKTLGKFMARHLAIVFHSFSNLRSFLDKENETKDLKSGEGSDFKVIMSKFIKDKVLNAQNWKGKYSSNANIDDIASGILTAIKKLLDFKGLKLDNSCAVAPNPSHEKTELQYNTAEKLEKEKGPQQHNI